MLNVATFVLECCYFIVLNACARDRGFLHGDAKPDGAGMGIVLSPRTGMGTGAV